MSVISAALRELIAAGLTGEALVQAIERIEAAHTPAKAQDEQAERRRAKDRERKRLRNSAESAESVEFCGKGFPLVPPSLSPAPLTLPPIIPLPKDSASGKIRQVEEEFQAWWKLYPRKVGIDAARKRYWIARKDCSAEQLLAAVVRHAEDMAATEPQFIPHASTWLSGGRHKDIIEDLAAAPTDDSGMWTDWQKAVAERHGKAVVRSWFLDAEVDGETLIAETKFKKEWITQNYADALRGAGIKHISHREAA